MPKIGLVCRFRALGVGVWGSGLGFGDCYRMGECVALRACFRRVPKSLFEQRWGMAGVLVHDLLRLGFGVPV